MLIILTIDLFEFTLQKCYIDTLVDYFKPLYLKCNHGCNLYFSIVFCTEVLHNVQLTL